MRKERGGEGRGREWKREKKEGGEGWRERGAGVVEVEWEEGEGR